MLKYLRNNAIEWPKFSTLKIFYLKGQNCANIQTQAYL